jgi:hypothetical protein
MGHSVATPANTGFFLCANDRILRLFRLTFGLDTLAGMMDQERQGIPDFLLAKWKAFDWTLVLDEL